MNELCSVILDDIDILVFLDGLSHGKESAVRLATAIGPGRVTERITGANNVARHLDFGELRPVTMRKAEDKSFSGGLGRPVKIHRQVARDFAHRRTHTSHGSGTARVNKLLATSPCRTFEQHDRRTRVVHHHGTRGIAPAESNVDTGVTTLQAFGHCIEIGQRTFYKGYVGHRLECRHLVRMPRGNNDLMTFLQNGLDDIVTNETGTTCNENTHNNLFVPKIQTF